MDPKELIDLNKSLPPEVELRQPGAYDHEAAGHWLAGHKVLGYVFVGVIVAATVSVIYYYQVVMGVSYLNLPAHLPPPGSMSDWKTYTDAQNGFEFRYPTYLNVKNLGTGFVVFTKANEDVSEGITHGVIKGKYADGMKNLAAAVDVVNTKSVTINDLKWQISIQKEKATSIVSQVFYLERKDDFITFSATDKAGIEDLIERILATFKLTAKAPCIQVITKAKNISTAEIRDFPTPCDIPAGWVKLNP